MAPTTMIDWAVFNVSANTVSRLSGRQFYRSKDPTNSIKVLKKTIDNDLTQRIVV